MSNSQFRKTKPTWYNDTLNPIGMKATKNIDPSEYRPKAPWGQDSKELVDEFDRCLDMMDAEVKSPWDEDSVDLRIKSKQVQDASNYKFHSLFEEPELSQEKKKQLAEYKINPPFNCGYNKVDEVQKSAKKLYPGKDTKQPWAYGAMPAEPMKRKIHEKPSTALWDVPKGDQSNQPAFVSSGDPILDSLRMQLRNRGASGIAGLSRKFKIMDDNGSGTLDYNEFRKGMKECAIADLTEKQLKHLFLYFDKDDSGAIGYDEFLVGIRGVLNDRRKGMVLLAFKVLDKDRSGQIDINDIKDVYDPRGHPDVIAGRKTPDEILKQFIEAFEVGRERDGIVTLKEFEDYYANISASIDDDDYFELMIRNAWHISGGQGVCANTTNRRVLVTHADGRQTVEEITNDIGIRAKDSDKMMDRLKQQGHTVATINTTGANDMDGQIENKDFYKIRQNIMVAQLDAKYGAPSSGDQILPPSANAPSRGRLNNYVNENKCVPGFQKGNPAKPNSLSSLLLNSR